MLQRYLAFFDGLWSGVLILSGCGAAAIHVLLSTIESMQ